MKDKLLTLFICVGLYIFGKGMYYKAKESYMYPEISERLIDKLPVNSAALNDCVFSGQCVAQFFNQIEAQMTFRFHPAFGKVYMGNTVNIIIDSYGGRIDVLENLVKAIKRGRIKTKCYILDARSAAFSFIQQACTERILLKGAVLMTHNAYTPGRSFQKHYITVLNKNLCIKEAFKPRINPRKWCKESRGKEDRYWTNEEALAWKLVDRILK